MSWLGGRCQPAGTDLLTGSPPGLLTLLSLGPSGQAVGSSRLRSSPSKMDEDLSEFREKASVSASCTYGKRWQPQVPPVSSSKMLAGGARGPEVC